MILGCLTGKFQTEQGSGFTNCAVPANWVSPDISSPYQAGLIPGINGVSGIPK